MSEIWHEKHINAPTNRSDLTGNTNKVIRSHQAAGVNRSLHTRCCHQLYFIHRTHEHAARAALHVGPGLKRGREISLSSTSMSATRRFEGTSGGTRAKWRFGVSLCSFASFLCSLKNHPSANSFRFLPPSFLLPSCSGGALSTDLLKKHLSWCNYHLAEQQAVPQSRPPHTKLLPGRRKMLDNLPFPRLPLSLSRWETSLIA